MTWEWVAVIVATFVFIAFVMSWVESFVVAVASARLSRFEATHRSWHYRHKIEVQDGRVGSWYPEEWRS